MGLEKSESLRGLGHPNTLENVGMSVSRAPYQGAQRAAGKRGVSVEDDCL